jgi:hypothetical protein
VARPQRELSDSADARRRRLVTERSLASGGHGARCGTRCSRLRAAHGARRRLGWEAATERCLDAASIGESEWPTSRTAAQDSLLWGTYNMFTGRAYAWRACPWPPGALCFPALLPACAPA